MSLVLSDLHKHPKWASQSVMIQLPDPNYAGRHPRALTRSYEISWSIQDHWRHHKREKRSQGGEGLLLR